MTHARSFLPAVVLSVSMGCGLGVTIEQNIPEQTITGNAQVHASGMVSTLAVGSDVGATDTSIATKLQLEAVTLVVTSTQEPAGDSDCWDFVQSVHVFVEGRNLPRVEVASGTAPGCVRSMVLAPVGEQDLLAYAKNGFHLSIEATGILPAENLSFGGRVLLRAGL